MVLYLDDADVERLMPLDEATDRIEELFVEEWKGQVHHRPTTELPLTRGFFRLKAGAVYGLNSYGFKAYGTGRYIVFVYSLEDNALYGIVEAHRLTEIRTGAVTAVGVRHMARPDARSLAIIGTGREARTQVPAVCVARSIDSIRAFSRNPEKRERFAEEMRAKLGIDVQAVSSAEACVRDADIVVTMTNARDPVLEGAWLAGGTFVCGVGATTPERRELDVEAVARAGTIVVEHRPQAEAECGELREAAQQGRLNWSDVRELKEIVGGGIPGRRSAEEITLFDTIGVGSEDVALAAYVLARAKAENAGTILPL
jgi:alanine dehydrogenase